MQFCQELNEKSFEKNPPHFVEISQRKTQNAEDVTYSEPPETINSRKPFRTETYVVEFPRLIYEPRHRVSHFNFVGIALKAFLKCDCFSIREMLFSSAFIRS
jgi:hypothetical protein